MAAMIALMTIGVMAISVSVSLDPAVSGQVVKQIIFAAIGLAVFAVCTIIPYQKIGKFAYLLFGITLAVLVILLVPKALAAVGIRIGFLDKILPSIRGARRWINLGFVMAQPSEVAKLTYVCMLAWYLRIGENYRTLKGLIVPFALALLPMALILVEPDLGTALLFLPTLYVMLLLAGAKIQHLLLIVGLGLAVLLVPVGRTVEGDSSPIAYCSLKADATGRQRVLQPLFLRVLKAHQSSRIEGWLRQDDRTARMNAGYHLYWSKVTLASGGLTGFDSDKSDQDYGDMFPLVLPRLPDDHTDFIFSVIGGRWGFLGCVGTLGLYGVIFLLGIEIATITYDPFGRLLAVGVLALLLSQLVVNVGMTIGLMPVTGMTLPLVSYGGSSLVVNCAALGLLVNVGHRRPISLSRRPFEHGEKKEKRTNIEYTTLNDSFPGNARKGN